MGGMSAILAALEELSQKIEQVEVQPLKPVQGTLQSRSIGHGKKKI